MTATAASPYGIPEPIQLDPPDHIRYRNLLAPAFSPKAVVPLGERALALTIDLIESFEGGESANSFRRSLDACRSAS